MRVSDDRPRKYLGRALPSLAILAIAGQLSAQSVGYHKDVEPILRMHCANCHTERNDWWSFAAPKGIDYSTYAKTMAGGQLGPIVVPGRPDKSLIYLAITRSDEMRMPLFGQPLTKEDILTIQHWIAEGAKEDKYSPLYREIIVPGVDLRAGDVPVHCRILSPAYLELDVLDGAQVVESHQAAVGENSGGLNVGGPGALITWTLNSDRFRSLSTARPIDNIVDLRLRVYPQEQSYTQTIFLVDFESKISLFRHAGALVDIIPNPLQLPSRTSSSIKFWLDHEADVTVTILPESGRNPLTSDILRDLGRDLNYYKWKVPSGNILPGRYSAILREQDPRTGKHILTIGADFVISKVVTP